MNLGPAAVNLTYRYLLNQSGTNITLGDNSAVNWNGANVVARTGAQTISGIKTFTSNILASSFGNGATNNQFGYQSTSSNIFGNEAPNNYFGDYATSLNSFGAGAAVNYFGVGSNNSFGGSEDTTTNNSFGVNCQSNNFGTNSLGNDFGNNSTSNSFGSSAATNTFGDNATMINSFGNSAVSNSFGDGATESNNFGTNSPLNTFGGGLFNSGIKLLLPEFSGPSSQDGQFGELRISGSGLYVCTGATGGWRRTFLLSF
jgi:hypothetical protein